MATVIVHRPHGKYQEFDRLDDSKVIHWIQSGAAKRALNRSPRALALEAFYCAGNESFHIRMIPSSAMYDIDTTFSILEQEQDSWIGT